MKQKLTIFLTIVLALCCLTSCTPIRVSGLSNWEEATSSVSLTKYLFPSQDFLIQFTYDKGVYEYFDSCNHLKPLETVFAVTEYEEEIYLKAKRYCLGEMYLSQSHVFEYNGYVFIENLKLPEAYGNLENGENNRFPHFSIFFGYNDSLNELFFFGLYGGEDLYKDKELSDSDVGEFLEIFYSEYYDFDRNIEEAS